LKAGVAIAAPAFKTPRRVRLVESFIVPPADGGRGRNGRA